jgi:hypothetical protein
MGTKQSQRALADGSLSSLAFSNWTLPLESCLMIGSG